jgi:hypothetical protein
MDSPGPGSRRDLGPFAARGKREGGKKLYTHASQHRARVFIPLAISASITGAIVGCGTEPGNFFAVRPLLTSECTSPDGEPLPASDLVLLDWDGGVSPLYPNITIDALDLAEFPTADGDTLADRAEEFKEAVRGQITLIYCEFPDANIRVEQRTGSYRGAATVVQYGQILSPTGGVQIGEGEYDPCNRYHDDAAVIYAEQIRRLGGPYTFEQWVLMFANVTAHEIGHTLGYGHIERSEQPTRSLYVELMLTGHTISELQREQRYLVPQDTCSKDATAARCTQTPIVD